MRLLVAAALALPIAAHANGRPELSSTINFRQGHEQDVAAGMTFGMVITHDGGATWHWMCEKAILYGGMYDPDYAYTATGALFATTFDGFLVNRDGCVFGPTALGTTEVSQVAQAPDGTLYFSAVHPAFGTDPGDAKLYKSLDNGMTITPLGAPGIVNDWYSSLEVAPTDPNRVYLTGYRFDANNARLLQLYRSDDAGGTFAPLPAAQFVHGDNSTLDIVGIKRGAPDTVFARVSDLDEAGAAAIWRSDDAGQSWTKILDTPAPVAVLLRANGDLVAAMQLMGAQVSRGPANLTWEPLPTAPHINVLAENTAGEVWAGTINFASMRLPVSDDAGIMKSTDLATWTKVLRYQDIAGPVDCPAGTRQHDQCVYDCPDMIYDADPAQCPNAEPRSWCAFKRQLQIESDVYACTDVDREIELPAKQGCCETGGGDGRGAALLAGLALIVVRRRR